MQIVFDYLTMSSKIHDYRHFIDALGMGECNFMSMPGRNGWTDRLWYNGVSFYFGGRDDICIELSGTGCRTVEEMSGDTFDWLGYLGGYVQDIKARDMNISRIDIAGDDRDGLLNYRRMTAHCKHRRYICKARFNIWIDGDEQAIYFGSPASDRRLRIYNKAIEQGIDGHWIRCEMQMRNDNAVSFLLNWLEYKNIGRCYGSVLRDFLRYTDTAPEGKHHARCTVCTWWERFLGSIENCPQLYLDSSTYTLWHVQEFLKRQASSSLKLWLEANDGDITDIVAMIDDAKLNHRQEVLLDKIKSSRRDSDV